VVAGLPSGVPTHSSGRTHAARYAHRGAKRIRNTIRDLIRYVSIMRWMDAFSGIALTLVLVAGMASGSSCDSGGSSENGWGTVDAGLVERIKGDDLLKQGRYDEALSAYEKATGYDPYSTAPWRGKCKALIALDRPDEAIAACERALELSPTDMDTRSLLRDAISAGSSVEPGVSKTRVPMMLSIDRISVPPQSKVTIPVKVTRADNLGRIAFTVTYDSSLLKFLHGTPGGISPEGQVSFTGQDPGSVAVTMTDTQGISGNGTLVNLVFDVIGDGGTSSTLNVNVISAASADLADIHPATQDGMVSVRAPVCAGIVLLGILGAVFLVISRRSRDH